MIYPFVPVGSIADPVYLLHDRVVVPLKGRFFDRYAPIPHLVLLILAAAAAGALVARDLGAQVYSAAVAAWLRHHPSRRLLSAWFRVGPGDGHLRAEIEARHRQAVAMWFAFPDKAGADVILRMGTDLMGPLGRPLGIRGDIALAGTAALHLALTRAAQVDGLSDQIAVADRFLGSGGPLSALFRQMNQSTANPQAQDDLLDRAWEMADRLPEPDATLAREVVLWISVSVSLMQCDVAPLRRVQTRVAAVAFARDLRGKAAVGTGPALDPIVGLIDQSRTKDDVFPGTALSGEALRDLRSAVAVAKGGTK